jgi:hypothetical protein
MKQNSGVSPQTASHLGNHQGRSPHDVILEQRAFLEEKLDVSTSLDSTKSDEQKQVDDAKKALAK